MAKYNFDKKIARKPLNSYKWDVDDGVLPLTIADTDFCSPFEVSDAVKNITNTPTYGYTYVPKAYFNAYINWWKNRYNINLDIDSFMFSTGIVASIDSVIKRISKEGDKIALFSPNYNVFYNCISNNKRAINEVPFSYQNFKYSIDWGLLESTLKESKIFILCNPHNPIGIKFDKYELSRIIDLCNKYDVYLLSDEIHCDLDYNKEKYDSILSVNKYEKTIVFFSPGKIFNLAGLHSSVVYIENQELKNTIQKGLYEDDIGEPSIFSIDPVIAAYNHGASYVKEINEYINVNRSYIEEFFSKNGLKCQIIGGKYTYLLWIDISNYTSDSDNFADRLLKEKKVAVISGKHYHQHYSQFIRINIATQKENIVLFCDRLKEFVQK